MVDAFGTGQERWHDDERRRVTFGYPEISTTFVNDETRRVAEHLTTLLELLSSQLAPDAASAVPAGSVVDLTA